MYLIFTFVLICQLSFFSCLIEPEGPQCSKFDYDVKMVYKLVKVEEKVKSFEIILDEMKEKQSRFMVEQKQILEKAMDNLTEQFEALTQSHGQESLEQKQRLDTALKMLNNVSEEWLNDTRQKSETLLTSLDISMDNFTERFKKLAKAPAIGFSVKSPNGKSSSGNLKFSIITTNAGDSYDKITGEFTCTVPGYYYIAAMLLKKQAHTGYSYCHVYRNGTYLVIAYTYPGTSSNSHNAAVNSVFVHLDKGDTIRLASCTADSSLHQYSSFSGFLVTPDPE